MSDHSTVASDLTSQYVAQVTNDLERNAKEQERVGAEIAELQQQLAALRRDHGLLVKMRHALDLAAGSAADAVSAEEGVPTTEAVEDGAVAEPASATASPAGKTAEPAEETAASGRASVPAPRNRSAVKSEAEKPKRKKATAGRSTAPAKSGGAKKTSGSVKAAGAGAAKRAGTAKAGSTAKADGASKPAGSAKPGGATSGRTPATPEPAGRASAVKAPRKAPAKAAERAQGDAPKLVDLVRRHLDERKEPRSAAEVATALGQAHPGRTVKVTVVRSTLEGLVARNQAQRSKQGTSVFYTAPDASTPAPERAADAQV
ncbi:hypothetical protein ROS62_13925 [Streptomyces sp. DSM 41972]|uniref:Regulatory protein n=1 Tax=Streptomyces althioticus subsp. attaecolombicae TaxID=3075534 RepID=A0ABU3HYZ4_9ACTN|nr:hypothetical protein [Streptomyces sp. DSM 41972]SCD78619.1 hypothetical protein GA0115238_124719 [Streptomyces sp. di50b]SCD89477.1 hypothetical protein GA0115245_116128 [Streptomyces sp. di188]